MGSPSTPDFSKQQALQEKMLKQQQKRQQNALEAAQRNREAIFAQDRDDIWS